MGSVPVSPSPGPSPSDHHEPPGDGCFYAALLILGGSYVLLVILMVGANLVFTDYTRFLQTVLTKEIRYATVLSMVSCSLSALISLWIATPIAYLMSRHSFPGKRLVDGLLDIPIVLPPMVIGISLLILFNVFPQRLANAIVFEIPAVIIAQTAVACAFAVRALRVAFDQIPTRYETVAQTLGASRSQAFWRVVMPQARRGLVAAGTLAWARSLGEFGPVLVFAGSTRLRTEVLPTSVYLEMQSGNLQGMLAVSILMIVAAVSALIVARVFGMRGLPA
jgi:molybdate transport system permease protein